MNIVSVMAHQDDELMCLGTMLRMREAGHSLAFVCLTDGSAGMVHMPDMPFAQAAEVRRTEMERLCASLDAQYICLNRSDEFLFDDAQIRTELIEAIRRTGAELIFTHNTTDYNADHMTANLLVRQCAMQSALPMLKTSTPCLKATPAVFMTEPSGGFEFEPSHWVDISPVMEQKAACAKYHVSQDDAFIAAFGEGKGIDNWVREAGKRRGAQCGAEYAEAFRPMLARGLVKPYSLLP